MYEDKKQNKSDYSWATQFRISRVSKSNIILIAEFESKEHATLVSCSDRLEIALTGDRDILHFLEREGYNIPDDV